MSASPPRDHVFRILGMIDARAAGEIEAALRALDPAVQVRPALPQGLLTVRSTLPAGTLARAIESAGYGADPTDRTMPPPSPYTGTAVARLVARAGLWGLVWTLIAPIVTGLALGATMLADPRCGTPGDSGGCAMGLVSAALAAAPAGFALGFLVTVWRGVMRMRTATLPQT